MRGPNKNTFCLKSSQFDFPLKFNHLAACFDWDFLSGHIRSLHVKIILLLNSSVDHNMKEVLGGLGRKLRALRQKPILTFFNIGKAILKKIELMK